MNMVSVESKMLKAVGYDKISHTLSVTFHNNSTYNYADVPEQIYMEMMGSASIGGFFAKNIRNHYENQHQL